MSKPHQQFIERQRKARASRGMDVDAFLAELQRAKRRVDEQSKSNVVAPIIGITLEMIIHAVIRAKDNSQVILDSSPAPRGETANDYSV